MSESKCQRSKTTGHLMVIMPKLNQKDTSVNFVKIDPKKTVNPAKAALAAERVKKTGTKTTSIHDLMMQDAVSASSGGGGRGEGGGGGGGGDGDNSSNSSSSSGKPEFLEIGGRLNATKVKSTDFTNIVRKPQAGHDGDKTSVFDKKTEMGKALISEIDE